MRPLRQVLRFSLVGVPAIVLGSGHAIGRAHDAPPPPRVLSAVIEGRVEISRALSTRRARFRIYAQPGAAQAPASTQPPDEWRNIVVYIERVPPPVGTGIPERVLLRQRNERFVPHVLPIVRGTTVEFPNEDALFHNVFSLSRAKEFDLGRYPHGASKEVTFDQPGIVQVFCHIHSDMSAVVLVLDNGYFAVPDNSGRYSIPDLPPGEYTLVAWHERIRPITQRLRVEPGQIARVDFTISLPAADAARTQ